MFYMHWFNLEANLICFHLNLEFSEFFINFNQFCETNSNESFCTSVHNSLNKYIINCFFIKLKA